MSPFLKRGRGFCLLERPPPPTPPSNSEWNEPKTKKTPHQKRKWPKTTSGGPYFVFKSRCEWPDKQMRVPNFDVRRPKKLHKDKTT